MRENEVEIVQVYADALIAAGEASGALDTLLPEAVELRSVLAGNPDIIRAVDEPLLEKGEKKALVRRIFENRIAPLLLNLVLLLIDNRRAGLWLDILDLFIVEAEEKRGIVAGELRTARPLSDEQKARLTESLERHIGKRLRLTFREDPDLLGGVRFRCKGLVIDSTVQDALKHLEHRFRLVKI